MIEEIICEEQSHINYQSLSEDRKLKYIDIYNKANCCPEKYILGLVIASPNSKDYCCVVKYNYEEYLKGNKIIKSVEYF